MADLHFPHASQICTRAWRQGTTQSQPPRWWCPSSCGSWSCSPSCWSLGICSSNHSAWFEQPERNSQIDDEMKGDFVLFSSPSISLSGWPGSPWSPMQCWSAHLSTCKWQNIKQELTKNRQKAPKSGLTQIYLSELHYEIPIFSPKWSLPSVQEFPNWSLPSVQEFPNWCRLTIATYQDDEFPKWSSHQIEINTKWCPPSDGNSSRWVNFNLGKSQNGWISILLEINLGASQWV